jgi:alkylation response protein AidB-like acyl-CoA dehydrogenase
MARMRALMREPMPLPGGGATAERHRRLMAVGREDLSLAKLAEAHWDAVAILAESGRAAREGALYGVWASERPGRELAFDQLNGGLGVSGQKMFLSGAGLCDRALVTVGASPGLMVDLDLRANADRIAFDGTNWKTRAFADTCTATGTFEGAWVDEADVISEPGWYVDRPGLWHGACGPAACWAGGAAGLLDFALRQKRDDPHTMAHLGAMRAEVWGMGAALDAAGREIDAGGDSEGDGMVRALTVRHLVERACTEVLRRVTRAYGPGPMAMDADFLRRCEELELYVRQSHAERDLEELGRGSRQAG